jgi:glucuronoarabinoxylan endo-1,4-beta-xylanase
MLRSAGRAVRMTMAMAAPLVAGCGTTTGPRTGGLTNWLSECSIDADCGDLRCWCGVCTRSCGAAENCAALAGADCVPAADEGAVALCSGDRPTSLGMCLLRCGEEDCAPGTSCVAGVCAPLRTPTVRVAVDESVRFQTLVGIGAGIGYLFDAIAEHPRKAAMFDAMFADSGFTVLRLRNRYGQAGEEDLSSTSEMVAAAAERLGQPPLIILDSASPPPALKANGSNWCEDEPEACTLTRRPDGSFDYAGFAAHWRASLEAYASAGVFPDYVSIQNNPDWSPPLGNANEACRFLPTEGTATVATDAGDVEIEYPGYAQALEAVRGELVQLASVPKFNAPDTTSIDAVSDYVAELELAPGDAIAHHLYESDPSALDLAEFTDLAELGQARGSPLFQTEIAADAMDTAVLMHATLAIENAVAYVQNGFVEYDSSDDPDPVALIHATTDDFTIGDTYHAMRQYSAHIAPGWTRVSADADDGDLLVSAWTSPAADTLVVVLTNPGAEDLTVQLETGAAVSRDSSVVRTTLGGIERSAELGELAAEGIVTVPAQALVTVTLEM